MKRQQSARGMWRTTNRKILYGCEMLETRCLLSAISWTNRNDFNGANDNRFDDVFGSLQNQAIAVVDAAITFWARTISNFNYSNGTNTYNVDIRMNPSASNVGANAQTNANIGGKPSGATVGIGWINQGVSGNTAGGWWVDPSPFDSSEFNFELNGFVSQPTTNLGGADLFTVVAHELGHAMGLASSTAMNALGGDTNQNDTINAPASSPVSTYWYVNTPSVQSLWTEWDSGGAGGSANNAAGVQHFAPNGAQFPLVNPIYFGAFALMNAQFTSRSIISNVEALMLQEGYGYSITLPTTYGTMYNKLNANGQLQIGLPSGARNDEVSISSSGSILSVTMRLGTPVPGIDPVGYYTSSYLASDVTSIRIDADGGDDVVTIHAIGSTPVTVIGGAGDDSLFINGATGTNTLGFSAFSGGLHSLTQISSTENVILNGSGGGEQFVINAFPFGAVSLTVNGNDGADTCTLGGGDLVNSIPSLSSFVFNGGTGVDGFALNNSTHTALNWSHGIYDTFVDSLAAGYYLAANYTSVSNVTIHGSQKDDSFIASTSGSITTVLNGNGGDDNFIVGGGNMSGYFPQAYDGGLGIDQITFDDSLNPSGKTWDINDNFNPGGLIYSGLILLFTTGFESVGILGGLGSDTFNFHNDLTQNYFVNGGSGADSDTFVWYAANNWYRNPVGGEITSYNVTLDGGNSGFDLLLIDDAGRADTVYDVTDTNLFASDFVEAADIDYAGFGAMTVLASGFGNSFAITGANPATSYTFDGRGDSDAFVLSVDPAVGGANIRCDGSGGTDYVTINDSIFSADANYLVTGTQMTRTSGLASRFFSLNTYESLNLIGTAGANTFNVTQVNAARPATLSGSDGDDVFNVSGTAVGATTTTSLWINGDNGYDQMNMNDAAVSSSVTYNVFSGTLQRGSSSVPNATLERIDVNAGTGNDDIIAFSTEPSVLLIVSGGNGNDRFFNGGLNCNGIQGAVQFWGEGGADNRIILQDFLDTAGVVAHLNENTIGSAPGDNLFGPGGSLYFNGVARVDVNFGSGADAVYVKPAADTQWFLFGNNPTTPPGDTLALALAGATDPVHTPSSASTGVWTFSNAMPVNYNGFEDAAVADSDPPFITADPIFHDESAPHTLSVTFSEDVSAALGYWSLSLTNLTTFEAIFPSLLDYDLNTNTAIFTFPGYNSADILPDGDYSGAVVAAAVLDLVGNAMAGDYPVSFFFLNGDATRDRRVDTQDFNILAFNFGETGKIFSEGNFNYDPNGDIDSLDFNVFVDQYGKSLPQPLAAAPALFSAITLEEDKPAD